jgi:hypothetical protein
MTHLRYEVCVFVTMHVESIKDDTIGGFNSYLGSLKAEAAAIDFTLIKFDSRRIEKVCVAVPVSQVAELTMESYQPGASTPLIDAAYKTIKAVEKSLNGSNPKVSRKLMARSASSAASAASISRAAASASKACATA